MTTVKFDHAVKYKGVRYAAHEAFKVDDAEVESLKRSGVIVLSVDPPAHDEDVQEEGKHDEGEGAVEGQVDIKSHLLTLTVPQLILFAEDNDIDLQGKTRKADIYNIIVAALN